ncbi:MAG: GGDEF domain-containing protein [Clostridiales bacterium]|nr:GGDEF domain-containing protein [Clostridiales bacterium]
MISFRRRFHSTALAETGLYADWGTGVKIKSYLSNIYREVCKDTGGKNESSKLIVVVRLLTLVMLVYTLATCILSLLSGHRGGVAFYLVSLVFFIVIFIMSYKYSTFVSYCILNVYILAWVFANIICFGWNIGVQLFLITLLLFCYFSRYRHEPAKVCYSILLIWLRIFLYYYCQNHSPIITLSPIINDAFQIVNTLAVFGSISIIAYIFSTDTQTLEGKLIEYNEKLQQQAHTDTLTGLYNRRRTMEYLDGLFHSATSQISICLCDIDFFKKVNDTYGHDVGDVVLQTLSQTFRQELPKDCFISRWGGEEFLLIFPQLNGDEAVSALETLRQKIKSIVFDGGTETFSVSMTFGLVEYDYRSDLNSLLKQADEKLYIGKESGRDRIVF